MTNQDPLDELDIHINDWVPEVPVDGRRLAKERIRAFIEAHYIERSKVEEAIGEDEYPANNQQNVNYLRTPEREARDKLRAEIRQKLGLDK